MSEEARLEPDLLLLGGRLITQDAERRVLPDHGVAIREGAICAIAPSATLRRLYPDAARLDASGCIVMPGLVNAHQHCTADPLVRSLIPDSIGSHEAIFGCATPLHGALTPEDDELSALLTAVESLRYGTTTVVEAGTVAHPDRVAAGLSRAGIRGTIGRWGWDTPGLPFSASAGEALRLQEELLRAFPKGGLIEGWVTLVGHELVSDDLLAGASDLALAHGTGLTFHMSPTEADVAAYLARDGLRPMAHLARLGILGPHLLLAHAVWMDEQEVDLLLESRSAVAYCPWAYLRLGQGVTGAGRHAALIARGGRVALGCDAVNAGDLPDMHRAAALAVGLARDMTMDTQAITAATGLDLVTIRGAEAIGMADRIGSIEIGKRADLVVHDGSAAAWRPAGDPALNLIWGTDGRTVRDVVVDGRIVLRNGRSTLVDEEELARRATEARDALLARSGVA
ncbi:amidohydrolase family protein [Flavisphingomonas formosensis]|uniref:amidohydrolase family protein n=1 Tax=Flavisphingomonas formosensis TaxID=861534 RepID=UPI0012F84BDA|nr:amidohydrolase family protein [Sphingomonas formosensis]